MTLFYKSVCYPSVLLVDGHMVKELCLGLTSNTVWTEGGFETRNFQINPFSVPLYEARVRLV